MEINTDGVLDMMEARGIKGIADLSRRTGIERSLLSRIIHGQRPAKPHHLKAIKEALRARPGTIAIYTKREAA